jgi:hypothetical protein
MKRIRKKQKILSLRVYGIMDIERETVIKVNLNKEELEFELELDNHDGNLILCSFDIKIKFLI